MGGKRPYALEGKRDWLLARIGEVPDLTLRAMTAELAARGIVVSHYAVWHFLVREGITFKKKACAPASKSGLMWPGGGRNGSVTKARLIPPVWCSSTRSGPRQT
jgi:transposase